MAHQRKTMLTVTEVSRRLDVPRSTIARLLVAGEIKPDARSSKAPLFREDRLDRLAACIAVHLSSPSQASRLGEIFSPRRMHVLS
jgi:excisionase family DNA binding protein